MSEIVPVPDAPRVIVPPELTPGQLNRSDLILPAAPLVSRLMLLGLAPVNPAIPLLAVIGARRRQVEIIRLRAGQVTPPLSQVRYMSVGRTRYSQIASRSRTCSHPEWRGPGADVAASSSGVQCDVGAQDRVGT